MDFYFITMKEIKLSQRGKNKGKFVTLVDDDDYEWLMQWRWFAHEHNTTFYAMRSDYYDERKVIAMHREIIDVPIGMDTDHIDHDGLNNQKSNLRICTRQKNIFNSRGRNRYKGIKLNPRTKKYGARIKINGEEMWLGTYPTEELAALAYNEKAIEIFGSFAHVNII